MTTKYFALIALVLPFLLLADDSAYESIRRSCVLASTL